MSVRRFCTSTLRNIIFSPNIRSPITCSKFIPECGAPTVTMVTQLEEFLHSHRHILVITGAGISTESGIPDYRSEEVGLYARKNYKPMLYQEFIKSASLRQRYWARSYVGWPQYSKIAPAFVHKILADWENLGFVHWMITQNVDHLHKKAGSKRLTELHGSLYEVGCLQCKSTMLRDEYQIQMKGLNPVWSVRSFEIATDGDVFLTDEQVEGFQVPPCKKCGGNMMPRIVFFGDNVPRNIVDFLHEKVQKCDSVLVLGSSLQVYSAYRFVWATSNQKKPIAIVNIGPTRGDKLCDIKINAKCGDIMSMVKPPTVT